MLLCPLLSIAASIAETQPDRREYAHEFDNFGNCVEDGCALWNADYGCGLSNNITDHAKAIHSATPKEER